MGLRPTDFLIGDMIHPSFIYHPNVDGQIKAHGYVERDYKLYPREMFDPPSSMPMIPKSEWSDRIKDLESQKASLSHIRGEIPSLDQGQVGYCWNHSTAHCVTILRAVAGLPYVPLSAYAVGATIKKGADEGGWCGLSAKFLRERGIPSQALWPQGDRDYRKYDKPEVWANAALHKVSEDWVDLTREVYDQSLTFEQVASCLLSGTPCAVDFNWWGHSVCALDLVEISSGNFGLRIWNSWSDKWGDRGMGVLEGQKAIPNGAVALRVTGAGAV